MKKLVRILTLLITIGASLFSTVESQAKELAYGEKVTIYCPKSNGRFSTGVLTCVNPDGCSAMDVAVAMDYYCSHYANALPPNMGYVMFNDCIGELIVTKMASSVYQAHWQTLYENQSAYFQLQYSTDHVNWNNLTTTTALGYSTSLQSYNSTFVLPVTVTPGMPVYFRLRDLKSDLSELSNIDYTYIAPLARVANFNQHAEVNIYPNPSADRCTINFGEVGYENTTFVRIYDYTGKLVFSEEYIGQQGAEVDLSNFAEGVYVVDVSNNNMTTRKKLVKTNA